MGAVVGRPWVVPFTYSPAPHLRQDVHFPTDNPFLLDEMICDLQLHYGGYGGVRTVAEYLQFEKECRALAVKLKNPEDKRAVELMASAWARAAAERKAKLEKEAREGL